MLHHQCYGKGIDNLTLFIVDESGNYDMDMFFGNVMYMLSNMKKSSYNIGIVKR